MNEKDPRALPGPGVVNKPGGDPCNRPGWQLPRSRKVGQVLGGGLAYLVRASVFFWLPMLEPSQKPPTMLMTMSTPVTICVRRLVS